MSRLLIFLTGAAVGAGCAWVAAKRYFTNLKKVEFDSLKRAYELRDRHADTEQEQPAVDISKTSGDIKADVMDFYKNKIADEGYVGYSGKSADKSPAADRKPAADISENESGVHTISYEEFETGDYVKVPLIFYTDWSGPSDGVFMDEDNDIFDNAADIFGERIMKCIADAKDTFVFVRNHKLKIDYEIRIADEPSDC